MVPGAVLLLLCLVAALAACAGQDAGPGPATSPETLSTLPPPRELSVQSGDVTLFVRVAGDPRSGEVLLASHGGPGMTSHYMVDLEQLAGPNMAVVTYDQRGTGRSTAPTGGASDYELEDYADDLEAIRRAIGANKVHVLGHSWGGLVTMAYAAAYPKQVASLLLVSSGPPTWEAIEAGFAGLEIRIRVLQDEGIIPRALPADATGRLEAILPAYFADPAFSLPAAGDGPPEYSQVANQMTWQVVGDYDLTDQIATINKAVLIVWGEDDPFGLPMAEATRDALTGARVHFVVLKSCGHFWHECPAAFYEQVRAFLNSTD